MVLYYWVITLAMLEVKNCSTECIHVNQKNLQQNNRVYLFRKQRMQENELYWTWFLIGKLDWIYEYKR